MSDAAAGKRKAVENINDDALRARMRAEGWTFSCDDASKKEPKQEPAEQPADELGADLVATYMSNPTFLKQKFPKQAKLVRKAVNQSNLSEYISFHTIAGLLGAGAISSILLGLGGEDEEDRGVLSLGSGALSAA